MSEGINAATIMADKSSTGALMQTAKTQKKPLPPPGRKLTPSQARARVNKKFARALAMLAK